MADARDAEVRKSLFDRMQEAADEDARRFLAEQEERQVMGERTAQDMAERGVPEEKRPV